jgi:hypothetical protein
LNKKIYLLFLSFILTKEAGISKMVTEKEMDQSNFIKIAKEINAFAEVIRSRQDQKQVIIDDFNKERKRYQTGKISKKTLAASVPRVRKELQRLNNDIRKNIKNLHKIANRTKNFASRQSPKNFRVSVSGITLAGGKKKKHTRKRTNKTKKK